MTCYVNGKFLVQRLTGVQRFASELLMAVDGLLPRLGGLSRWVVLHPPHSRLPAYKHIQFQLAGSGHWPLHAWEQVALPAAARSGLLINLAGSAPWFARRQVCTFHDAAVFDRPEGYTRLFRTWYRALFRHAGRRACRVLTVSEFSRQRLAECLSMPSDRIGVISNAADHITRMTATPGVLEKMGLQERRYVLVIASASANKNLATLQLAFDQLPRELGLKLVVVGGGNPSVFAPSGAPADSPAVLRTGAIPDGQVKSLMMGALALAMPSYYEGFGLPALEAMAVGCPVVVSSAAALPEVCADAALYVDPHQPAQMTRSIARLATEPLLWAQLRDAGLARAREFQWSSSAERLIGEVGALA